MSASSRVVAVSSHNGSLSKDNKGFVDTEVNVNVYPKYEHVRPGYDVAIVELRRRFTFSEYDQPICIVDSFRENIGEVGYVVGYGASSVNGTVPGTRYWNVTLNDPDGMLRENLIEFRTVERCESVTMSVGSILISHFDRTICAVGNERVIAKGDSGGPLMINRKGVWYQVGTSSIGALFDDDDDKTKWMSMYSRLSRSCDWIEEVTRGYVKCASMDG